MRRAAYGKRALYPGNCRPTVVRVLRVLRHRGGMRCVLTTFCRYVHYINDVQKSWGGHYIANLCKVLSELIGLLKLKADHVLGHVWVAPAQQCRKGGFIDLIMVVSIGFIRRFTCVSLLIINETTPCVHSLHNAVGALFRTRLSDSHKPRHQAKAKPEGV